MDRQRGGRLRLKPPGGDWLPGVIAIAAGAVVDAGQRLLDLAQKGMRTIVIDQAKRPVLTGTSFVGLIALSVVFARIGGRYGVQFTLLVRAQLE